MSELAPIYGYRDDLQLEKRWWHRLAKVVYYIGATVAVIGASLLAWEARPEAKRSNVTVIASLQDVLEKSKAKDANAALTLANMTGDLGIVGANGDIQYLSNYGSLSVLSAARMLILRWRPLRSS